MKHLFSGIKQAPLLDKAFENIMVLHTRTHAMLELAFEAFFAHRIEMVPSVEKEDVCVNRFVKSTRKKVYEYLAWSTVPNISSSLTLASMLIDYERIGDLSVNIAQIGRNLPAALDPAADRGGYITELLAMRTEVLALFPELEQALKNDDADRAVTVIADHDRIKQRHNTLFQRLNAAPDGSLSINHAINFALVGYYIRRINGHIANVASSITQPYTKFGFKDEDFDGCIDPEFVKLYDAYCQARR